MDIQEKAELEQQRKKLPKFCADLGYSNLRKSRRREVGPMDTGRIWTETGSPWREMIQEFSKDKNTRDTGPSGWGGAVRRPAAHTPLCRQVLSPSREKRQGNPVASLCADGGTAGRGETARKPPPPPTPAPACTQLGTEQSEMIIPEVTEGGGTWYSCSLIDFAGRASGLGYYLEGKQI